MSKDLYLLVDGTHADPDECDVGADLELRHANGVPVALREDGNPQTVAQGAVENMNVEATQVGASQLAEPDVPLEDQPEPESPVVTDINPATGKSSDDDLLLTTDDLNPAPLAKAPTKALKPKAAKKPKVAKNREIRTR